ncbi:sugar MFS transporter [Hyphomicrobium sp.]|uniref:sugar MFS transporter n=1 Tax=Hyphomicrobium sp. TaxID=82 RepID=UPI002D7859B7|nr:sugar MFS transporter [Hyphomicrobium sp.]HET6390519.1 sugar MFS transporter [Hyphomicrobium sp.]
MPVFGAGKPRAARDEANGIATIAVLFFIFGFVAWLNGPLISFVKLAFDLDDVNAFLVPMAFYLSYFFLALPSSAILRRTGMKRGMALGLFVMAVGSVLFGEFTTMRWYPGTLTGLFIMGAGLALLQTASNPYVCILGPHESAARRIAVMGICHKFAGVVAPFVFAALVLKGIDSFDADVANAASPQVREALLDAFAARVHAPYMVMAALLALLGVWIARSRLPDLKAVPAHAEDAASASGASSIFDFPHLWLGVLCLFLYVGVEVLAGDAIGLYGTGFGLSLEATRLFTSYTLFAMLLGYVAGLFFVPRFFSQQTYLALSAALGIMLTIGAYATTGYASIAFIAALGFANAMMWPAIFPLAIRGLGSHTETGSALLIMAISGGALMPYAFGLLKEHMDFQLAYLLLAIPSYLYILYFGVSGWRQRAAKASLVRAQ